jgi:DNA polymerase-4
VNERSPRKIIHVDMDAFYASVEQRDRPALRGRPVVVGGSPDSRGVVAAASYEAREFGVHSALPCAQAYRRCPQAVFVRPDFAKYKAVSRHIHDVFQRAISLVEPLSLDEAYLDVTDNAWGERSATRVAARLRAEIKAETGLTASAGVAPNKFLAKVASDLDKPDGLVVIAPEDVSGVLEDLPLRRIPGVGRVTESRLKSLDLHTCGDVRRCDPARLAEHLGSYGTALQRLAAGVDPRPVVPSRGRKSCSIEDTFAQDLLTRAEALMKLEDLAQRLAQRLETSGTRGRTVVLKVKYHDFQQVTRTRTLSRNVCSGADLLREASALLSQTDAGRRPVRLLGIGVTQLAATSPQRLLPFDAAMRHGEL